MGVGAAATAVAIAGVSLAQVPAARRARALDFIFRQPVVGSAQFVAWSEIPKPTAQRFIALLRNAGLLHTARAPRGRRGGVYVFTELIVIVEGRALP